MERINLFAKTTLQVTETDFTRVNFTWSESAIFFPYYRIYLVTSGNATMYLHDEALELKPGNLYFIPAFSVTKANCEKTMEHYWFHFNMDITSVSYLSLYKPMLSIPMEDGDEYIFKNILKEFERAKQKCCSSNMLALESLAKYLFSRFLPQVEVSPEDSLFIPVLKYIDKHLSEKISNSELSKIICLNETYFSNAFTKQFGLPPKQYILKKRMSLAGKMLVETNMPVKEIAFQLGYDNEMYFNRTFHKFTGIPPGKYRKNYLHKD